MIPDEVMARLSWEKDEEVSPFKTIYVGKELISEEERHPLLVEGDRLLNVRNNKACDQLVLLIDTKKLSSYAKNGKEIPDILKKSVDSPVHLCRESTILEVVATPLTINGVHICLGDVVVEKASGSLYRILGVEGAYGQNYVDLKETNGFDETAARYCIDERNIKTIEIGDKYLLLYSVRWEAKYGLLP